MLYLALKRDLERISLARKYVLSHFELYDAMETILFISDAACYRHGDVLGETGMQPRYHFLLTEVPKRSTNIGISIPRNSSRSSRRAWCVFLPPHGYTPFTNISQYQIFHENGPVFHGDQLRELPDPIPARDEIIPDPDSIPLSVLNYPLGTKHEVPSAAYEEQVPTPPPEAGPDLV